MHSVLGFCNRPSVVSEAPGEAPTKESEDNVRPAKESVFLLRQDVREDVGDEDKKEVGDSCGEKAKTPGHCLLLRAENGKQGRLRE